MAFDLRRAVASQGEGKALPYHPAWASNAPTSSYSPGSSRTDALLSQREAAHHAQAYGGSEAMDWLYDCINLYADPAGTAPYALRKQDDGTRLVPHKTKGTPPDHEVGPADLYELLRKPNPFMLYQELLALLVIDLMLVGNGYWFKWGMTKDGKARALYRLAPSHVKIKTGAYGPKAYEYQPPGARKPLKIDPTQILHFRRPNPHSAFYGLGVVQGAGRAMDLDIALTDTMASYYENKADPSLIVQSDRRVPRDVFNKLRAQMRARVSGPSNAGELLVLEAGLKASSLSASASDALFADLGRLSRDRIMTKFRASPRLFGLLDEQSGSDKVSDFRREFDNSALRPFLTGLAGSISDGLTRPGWQVDLSIEYRSLLPPEEATKVGDAIAKVPGIKVREVRRQYTQFGIEESTGDPEIDEMVLNMPTLEADANGQVTLPSGQKVSASLVGADQPLGGEPGRPPAPGKTRAITKESAAAPGTQAQSGKALDEPFNVAEFERQLAELIVEQKAAAEAKAVNSAGENVSIGEIEGVQPPEDRFIAARSADITRSRDRMVADLRDAAHDLERDLLDHVEGKALKDSDLVGRVRRSKAWTTFRDRVEAILIEHGRDAAASGVMHSGLVLDDDVDYDDIVKSVVNRPEGIRSIVKTLKERAVRRVREAREANAERHDYEAAVRAVLSEWNDGQAVTIADTEATHIYNEATLTAAEAAGVGEVYVTDGEDDDQPCKDAHGSVWDIGTARQRRVEHPNCRRAFLPLAEVGSTA